MKIISQISKYSSKKPLALTLGMFDGVHIGHSAIIERLLLEAKNQNLEAGVLTFWPHPRTVFAPQEPLHLLNTMAEKSKILEDKGIDLLFLQDFNGEFRNLTAENFIRQILVEKLNAKYILVGHDHSFGKNKEGNFNLLKKYSSQFNFVTEQADAVSLGEFNISSTKVRDELNKGNILTANKLLGYPYSLTGLVIHGKKLGRTIGYPTANLSIDSQKLLPKKGAYIVEVLLDNVIHKGMMSIGTNPTVGGTSLTVEVYILDFNQDLYNREITVRFRDFLHDEIKFENIEKLIERLDEDKKRTEEFTF